MESCRNKRAGFTLLEMMTALALMTVVVGSAMMLFGNMSNSSQVLEAAARAETAARDHMDLMAREIRQSGLNAPNWNIAADAQSISFNKCLGTDGNNILWSPQITYSLTPTLGETFNGIDDNGNGLVDEGLLKRDEDTTPVNPLWEYIPGLPSMTYGGFVQAADLQFAAAQRAVTITLTVSNPSTPHGIVQGRQQVIVALRN